MPVTSPTRADSVRALEWSAAIERTSSTVPRRGLVPWRRRSFFTDNRVAFSAALDLDAGFPARELFVHHRTGASLLSTERREVVRSSAAADVVVAGAMRTKEQLRFRSFYLLGHRLGTMASLVVHQRLTASVGTPLVTGARVQAMLYGQGPFVIPRIFESGSATRLPSPGVADWVVEEVIDGVPVRVGDTAGASEVADQLIEQLAALWAYTGVTHEVLDSEQRDRALTAFAGLVAGAPDGLWPAELDRAGLERRAKSALADVRPMTVGPSHGDPGLGNVLRLPDGRLALVDWEDAGRRALAHDIVKVVMSAPDPLAAAARLADPAELRPAMAGAMPWRRQVAVALLLFLRGWRHRHNRAVKRRSIPANTRRMQAMLRVLDLLLDD